jgi:hypothetical protein
MFLVVTLHVAARVHSDILKNSERALSPLEEVSAGFAESKTTRFGLFRSNDVYRDAIPVVTVIPYNGRKI